MPSSIYSNDAMTSDEDEHRPPRNKSSTTASTTSTHRTRCGVCHACQRQDCGQCMYCVKKKKFGGNGDSKQACIHRRCQDIQERRKESRRKRGGSVDSSDTRDSMERPAKQARRKSTREKPDETTNSSHGTAVAKAVKTKGKTKKEDDKSEEENPLLAMLKDAFGNVPPPSLLEPSSNPTQTTTDKGPTSQFKYGMPIPEPIYDKCAGCGNLQAPAKSSSDTNPQSSNNNSSDQAGVIVLCDGPGCNREYHLECCLPTPLTKVPDGNYFCVDCHPEGAPLAALKQYLHHHDEERVAHFHKLPRMAWERYALSPELDFLYELWDRDWLDNKGNWTNEKEATTDQTNNSSTPDEEAQQAQMPRSELGRILELEHVLHGTSAAPPTAYSLEQICDLFLGKPIRLYCWVDDNYHAGRIVDYRKIDIECQNRSSYHAKPEPNLSQKKPGAPRRAKSGIMVEPDDDFFTNQVEFLVRFLPGSEEHRKVVLYHWMRLEEHSLAVGSHLVWGVYVPPDADVKEKGLKPKSLSSESPKDPTTKVLEDEDESSGYWKPSLLYLRSTRELLPISHLLRESDGEIFYHPKGLTSKAARKRKRVEPANGLPAGPTPGQDLVHFKLPSRLWALSRRMEHRTTSEQGDVYKLLKMESEARSIFAPHPHGKKDNKQTVSYSLAMVEHQEQQRIQQWHDFPLRNKLGPKALTSRDAYALGPVRFANPTASDGSVLTKRSGGYCPPAAAQLGTNKKDVSNEDEFADLCPLIPPPGLDRAYLMQRLAQQGLIEETTKDVAATLECHLI